MIEPVIGSSFDSLDRRLATRARHRYQVDNRSRASDAAIYAPGVLAALPSPSAQMNSARLRMGSRPDGWNIGRASDS
jgi:hypothetical protein